MASELLPSVLIFPVKVPLITPFFATDKASELSPKVLMLLVPAKFKVLLPSTKTPVELAPSVLTVELFNVVVEPLVNFKPKESEPVVSMVASAITRLAAED